MTKIKDTFKLHQAYNIHDIPNIWIILYNKSTLDVIPNSELLTNIHNDDVSTRIWCNEGVSTTQMVGDLNGYGTVWYDKVGIDNILSYSKVRERYRILFDETQNSFVVHKDDKKTHTFKQSEGGLYYLDTKPTRGDIFLITVKQNKQRYTRRQITQEK